MKILLIIILKCIIIINSQESCGSTDKPTKALDCTSMSTWFRSCCFKKNQNSSYGECVDAYTKKYGIQESDDNDYEIVCESYDQQITSDISFYCGLGNPNGIFDCFKYSTFSSSCCYLNNNGKRSCINLGMRYSGKHAVGNTEIVCGGNFIIYPIILFILFFIWVILKMYFSNFIK